MAKKTDGGKPEPQSEATQPEPSAAPEPTPEPAPEPQPEQPQELATEYDYVSTQQRAEIMGGNYSTVSQVAAKFNYSRAHIADYCQSGRIPAVKPMGSQWRIPNSVVEQMQREGLPTLPRKQPDGVRKIKVPAELQESVAPHPEDPQQDAKPKPRRLGPWLPFQD